MLRIFYHILFYIEILIGTTTQETASQFNLGDSGIIIPVGFKIGLIKGKCISINVDLDNTDNCLLVNQKIDIKEKIKMKPSK